MRPKSYGTPLAMVNDTAQDDLGGPMAAEIASTDSFRVWLENKPRAWAHILAIRAALRMLPTRWINENDGRDEAPVFRGAVLSWTACKWPSHEAHVSLVNAATRLGSGSVLYQAALSIAAEDDEIALVDAVAAIKAAVSVARTYAQHGVAPDDIWSALSSDLSYLDEMKASPEFAAVRLASRPLWHRRRPDWSVELTEAMRTQLLANDPRLRLWADWYDRRIAGADSVFGLPPAEDENISHRLSATSDRFWMRPFAQVTSEVAEWVDVVRPPLPLPESQNSVAPIFGTQEDGRIDLAADVDAARALRGDESADQHAEALFAVERAIAACRGNATVVIREKLERYREALGDTPAAIRPGLLIQRGEALRQELLLRERSGVVDSDLPPLLDSTVLALKGTVTAHNVMVELNGPLAIRDRAILGPDAVQTQISREDARAVIESAGEAGVVTPAARDALETAAELAPSEADPYNRLSRMLTETVRNFGRKVVSILAARMRTALYGGAVLNTAAATWAVEATIGLASASMVGVAATLAGGYKLGKWALTNETKLRGLFEGNESMQLLIDKLMSELRLLPLE